MFVFHDFLMPVLTCSVLAVLAVNIFVTHTGQKRSIRKSSDSSGCDYVTIMFRTLSHTPGATSVYGAIMEVASGSSFLAPALATGMDIHCFLYELSGFVCSRGGNQSHI